MEVAKLFGVLPLQLLPIPQSEYRKYVAYYFAVKEAMKPDSPSLEDELGGVDTDE